MKNTNKIIYDNFKNWLKNLNTEEYWEDFDTSHKDYLLGKNINIKKFNPENELKNYLQDLINFFKIEALWNEIAEKIWVNSYQKISDIFHEKVDEMIIKWYEWDDVYEDFLEKERKDLQIWFHNSVSNILKW